MTATAAALILLAEPLLADDPAADPPQGVVRIETIDGRSWLVDADGQPFFAHGVTHLGHVRLSDAEIAEAATVFDELGFNAHGYGCPDSLKSDRPYLEARGFAPNALYRVSDPKFGFLDVFDPDVKRSLARQTETMARQNRGNATLIGYCWSDLAAWPLQNSTGTNWVEWIRALPDDAPGQRAYAAFLAARDDGESETDRDRAFLRLIAREYFRVLGEATRRADPHHLVFGDRFTFETAVPEVVEEMLPYVDAIAIQPDYQPGFPAGRFVELAERTGKPILICDFAIRFRDGDVPVRGWKLQPGPAEAGRLYADYIRAAAASEHVIGSFWCQPVDAQPSFGRGGVKQGLLASGLVRRPELNEAMRQLNRHLAELAAGLRQPAGPPAVR